MSKEMFLSQVIQTEKMINDNRNSTICDDGAETDKVNPLKRAAKLSRHGHMKTKERLSLEIRKEWCKKARSQYPDKVAIIIEPHSDNIPQLKNPKFLIPITFRINEVMTVLRKKLDMTKNDALMLYAQKGETNKY